MLGVNFLILPLILSALFFKRTNFSYIIALLFCTGTAIGLYSQAAIPNLLLTLAIFLLTPLVCLGFAKRNAQFRMEVEQKKKAAQGAYAQRQKEHPLLKQVNVRLDSQVSRIAELYKITRDMSAVLTVQEIFAILGNKMRENFRFKSSRLILIDEETDPGKINYVLELLPERAGVRQVQAEQADAQILKRSLQRQKTNLIKENGMVLLPLVFDGEFLGVLVVGGLSVELVESFSILANQFSLEFKRIRLYQKIQRMAITDGLTGVAVRRYFLERLAEEIERSRRHNLKAALLMLDIDHFKQCNDRFGHLTGDVVLKGVAGKTRECVREIDLVGRFGGEEFSVLLPDTDKTSAQQVAERIRQSIDEHQFCAYDETVKIEVSIGVAGFPRDATAFEALVDKADRALYRAKQQGRNKVCVY